MNLSIVIPLYNEAASLPTLHEELCSLGQSQGYELDIIFVDDGSTDDSWKVVERLADGPVSTRGIRLRRNFGKATAIAAGTAEAHGARIVTLDADLQDDPAEIPKLLAKLDEGYDVVSGWKQDRKDPWSRRVASRGFNFLINVLTKVRLHDHNCGLKAYRPEVFDEIELYGGRHRFIPVLAAARGFRIAEVPVHHRPRAHGKSKYGAGRMVQGFLDLLTVCFVSGFSQRPQHVLGSAGLISFLAGFGGLAYLAVYWVLRMTSHPDWTPLHQRPIVIYCVAALLLGCQLLVAGFLAELIVARDARRRRGLGICQRVPDPGAAADVPPAGLRSADRETA